MNYTGCCFFAKDVPAKGSPHLIIAAVDCSGCVIFVPISSIKSGKYHDTACEIHPNEISLSNDGHLILSKDSFARYQWTFEASHNKIQEKQREGIYEIRCRISHDLVEKIRQGALVSEELEPIYKNFFKKS